MKVAKEERSNYTFLMIYDSVVYMNEKPNVIYFNFCLDPDHRALFHSALSQPPLLNAPSPRLLPAPGSNPHETVRYNFGFLAQGKRDKDAQPPAQQQSSERQSKRRR